MIDRAHERRLGGFDREIHHLIVLREDMPRIIERTLALIDDGGSPTFIRDGSLFRGSRASSTVYSDCTSARSGDGWILKAGFDHFIEEMRFGAIQLQQDQSVVRTVAYLRGECIGAPRLFARYASLQILEAANSVCKRALGLSIVSVGDDHGCDRFRSALRYMHTAFEKW